MYSALGIGNAKGCETHCSEGAHVVCVDRNTRLQRPRQKITETASALKLCTGLSNRTGHRLKRVHDDRECTRARLNETAPPWPYGDLIPPHPSRACGMAFFAPDTTGHIPDHKRAVHVCHYDGS